MYSAQLETFIRVADAGSFNKAAEELFISFPAVIKQINSLEARLRVRLFKRSHTGLALTPAGESLYRDSVYIVQYCRDALLRAKDAMQTARKQIRAGISPIMSGDFSARLWARLQDNCPQFAVSVVPFGATADNAREVVKRLGQNIDVIAFSLNEDGKRHFKAGYLPLFSLPIRCCVPSRHRLAKLDALRLEDLSGERLMLPVRGKMPEIDAVRDDIRKNHPLIRVVDFSAYDMDAFNRCAGEGDAILIIDAWKDAHPALKTMPLTPRREMSFGLVHPQNPSEDVREFLEMTRALASDACVEDIAAWL